MYFLRRFLPPDYADGISASRASITGYPLPSPRAISAHLHKVTYNTDHSHNNKTSQRVML